MPFSPRDGGATTSVQGGWARLDEHGGEHFPRTDPAVIVLVEHDDRLLLGSNVLWESGRFSLLAGFVEAGESAEQAVVREVLEESGVRVEDVRYVGSQPWPFPRSLMLGFRARLAEGADPDELVRDESEISELRWFTRDELRTPSADLKLPMGLSIARWLIDLWVDEGGPAGV
jgi:NAD+ diphosphatase